MPGQVMHTQFREHYLAFLRRLGEINRDNILPQEYAHDPLWFNLKAALGTPVNDC
ncbi:hypothetical protein D3C81_2285820 [compost metagenome]